MYKLYSNRTWFLLFSVRNNDYNEVREDYQNQMAKNVTQNVGNVHHVPRTNEMSSVVTLHGQVLTQSLISDVSGEHENGSLQSFISIDDMVSKGVSSDGSTIVHHQLIQKMQEEIATLKSLQQKDAQEILMLKSQLKLLCDEFEKIRLDNLALVAKIVNKQHKK